VTAEGLCQVARDNLVSMTPEMGSLADQFGTLAKRADLHGLTKPSEMLRHMEREIRLILHQADAVIGAVQAAEGKETHGR
jgi:hypothetical protein